MQADEDGAILRALCINKHGERVRGVIERLKRLYRQNGLGSKHLLTRALGLLEEIEYELDHGDAPASGKRWEIQILQERVKIVQCVGGIVLYFHYDTILRPQIQIIAKLTSALTTGGHALLESPTGTGKTAAIVAAVGSWLKHNLSRPGPRVQVFYLTRTHSQIRQVLGEVRRCCFRLDVACLGSRAVACPMVKRGSDIKSADSFCQSARAGEEGDPNGCRYYRGLESKDFASMIHFRCRTLSHRIADPLRKGDVTARYELKDGLWDIEELVDLCTENNAAVSNEPVPSRNKKQKSIISYFVREGPHVGCPYYTAKSLSALADIVICPYSYVIDVTLPATDETIVERALATPKTELQQKLLDRALAFLPDRSIGAGARLPMGNNVIVIDEAHNIESFCKERGSLDVSVVQLRAAGSWLRDLCPNRSNKDKMANKSLEAVQDHALHVYGFVSNFAANVRRISAAATGSFVTWDRYDHVEDKLGGAAQFLKDFEITFLDAFLALANMYYITSFATLLSSVANFTSPYKRMLVNLLSILVLVCQYSESYAVRLEAGTEGTPRLKLWLQRAGVVLDPISRKAKSLLLTSGTLAPLNVTSASLGESFVKRLGKCTLEAGHVISKEQFALFTLSTMPLRGGGGVVLECVHRNLKNNDFLASLGTVVASLSALLPGNILIFFPSRDLVRRCIELWKHSQHSCGRDGSTILDRLARAKEELFIEPKTSLEFQDIVLRMEQVRSFILLATFRGHASEGLNLGVQSLVLIGLPFANRVDPAVDASIRFGAVAGVGDWYLIDAYRAINQSIGRCIRKKSDRGIVLLLDSRHSTYCGNLSAWLRPHLSHVDEFTRLERLIASHSAAYTTSISDYILPPSPP